MTSHTGPRRILYCESNMDGTIGGSHYCLLNLARGLDRSAFEPLAVFYEDHALMNVFREAGIESRVLPKRRGLGAGLQQAPPGLFRTVARSTARAMNVLGFTRDVLSYAWFLQRERISLVHLNNSVMRHQDWMVAALLSGVPCITHERGINREYSRLARFLSPRLVAVISMSKAIRDIMVDRGVDGRNITVMYDGLDPTRMKPQRSAEDVRRTFGIASDRPVVGIVGNIREWKGQEVVVRAMAHVVKQYPTTACLLVGNSTTGDAPYVAKLEGLIKEFNLEENVIFSGYQRNVADCLNIFDVAIHASIEPEPFGMVVLEAMAMRKPVIGSRAGGPPEMIIEGVTGLTFAPGDAAQLGAAVISLLENPQRTRQMGDRGYDRVVKDFDLPRYVRDVEALYRDALAGRTPTLDGAAISASLRS